MNKMEPLSGHLRVLITNTSISRYTGSELFVRDIAFELRRRGHIPVLYSPQLGPIAQALRDSGISVVDDLQQVREPPDLIHGQHHLEAMTAIVRFPRVPALLFCHGITPWQEAPFFHPRILYYVALSEMIREHMISKYNIPSNRIVQFSNFVNLQKFRPRPFSLPTRPRRALIFSNNASDANFVSPVRVACSQHGIHLDVIGEASGAPTSTPEKILQKYDIVFARGRSALESLVVGAAVICCDVEGLGSMVTTDNWGWFRRYNFGLYTLDRPITPEFIYQEITKYNPTNATEVSQLTREKSGLSTAIDRLLEIYHDCISAWLEISPDAIPNNSDSNAVSDFLRRLTPQINGLYQQNASLASELHAVNNSLTWRLRKRVLASVPLWWISRFIKSGLETISTTLKDYKYHADKE
jgi:hypothetical protein